MGGDRCWLAVRLASAATKLAPDATTFEALAILFDVSSGHPGFSWVSYVSYCNKKPEGGSVWDSVCAGQAAPVRRVGLRKCLRCTCKRGNNLGLHSVAWGQSRAAICGLRESRAAIYLREER